MLHGKEIFCTCVWLGNKKLEVSGEGKSAQKRFHEPARHSRELVYVRYSRKVVWAALLYRFMVCAWRPLCRDVNTQKVKY